MDWLAGTNGPPQARRLAGGPRTARPLTCLGNDGLSTTLTPALTTAAFVHGQAAATTLRSCRKQTHKRRVAPARPRPRPSSGRLSRSVDPHAHGTVRTVPRTKWLRTAEHCKKGEDSPRTQRSRTADSASRSGHSAALSCAVLLAAAGTDPFTFHCVLCITVYAPRGGSSCTACSLRSMATRS